LQIRQLATGETELAGQLDQVTLHGVLARIRDLNLTLLAVNQLRESLTSDVENQPERGGEVQP